MRWTHSHMLNDSTCREHDDQRGTHQQTTLNAFVPLTMCYHTRQLHRLHSPSTTRSKHGRQAVRPLKSMSAPASTGTSVPTHTDKLLFVSGVALIQAPDQAHSSPRVLLAQRPPGKAHAGLWEFPGGKVDPGETPEGALVRELKEELAIQVRPEDLKPVSFVSFPYPTFHLFMPLYACHHWEGEPHGAEGQDLVWVAEDQLLTYNLTPADIPLLAPLRQYMRQCV